MVLRVRKEGYWSIYDLADRWGLHPTSVYGFIRKGALHADTFEVEGRKHPMMFVPDDEVRLHEDMGTFQRTARRVDPLEARAFEMFRAGKQMPDVVIALRVTPQTVDKWFAEYTNADLSLRQITRKVDNDLSRLIPPTPVRKRRSWNKSKIVKSAKAATPNK